MTSRYFTGSFYFLLLFFNTFSYVLAQDTGTKPLVKFEPFIGGKWYLGENYYQTVEWGLNKAQMKVKAYMISGGDEQLVSEGVWFWHPGEEVIKGYFTAINMPVVFFDYTSTFSSDTLVNEIISYTKDGTPSQYLEKWALTDSAHFKWTLFRKDGTTLKKEMEGDYIRH